MNLNHNARMESLVTKTDHALLLLNHAIDLYPNNIDHEIEDMLQIISNLIVNYNHIKEALDLVQKLPIYLRNTDNFSIEKFISLNEDRYKNTKELVERRHSRTAGEGKNKFNVLKTIICIAFEIYC